MGLYRKKPVTIEAREFDKENAEDVAVWCGGGLRVDDLGIYIDIPTLEGITVASFGDFVIKGVAGEFYACKPDIFWMTYEDMETKNRTSLDTEFLHDGFYHDS